MRNSNNHSLTVNRFRWLGTALRALALAGALLALAASAAAAQPPSPDPEPFGETVPFPTIVHISTPNGFDWGDAPIGAVAGLAISLVAFGGPLSIHRRREHAANTISPIT